MKSAFREIILVKVVKKMKRMPKYHIVTVSGKLLKFPNMVRNFISNSQVSDIIDCK